MANRAHTNRKLGTDVIAIQPHSCSNSTLAFAGGKQGRCCGLKMAAALGRGLSWENNSSHKPAKLAGGTARTAEQTRAACKARKHKTVPLLEAAPAVLEPPYRRDAAVDVMTQRCSC